jgi:hypothetical protein
MPVYNDASSLFEIDGPVPAANVLAPLPIKVEQIQAIREAFERAGVVSQDDRRALIESVVVREVASLRELKAADAPRILRRIEGLRSPRTAFSGSTWDNREEDTWIDKL